MLFLFFYERVLYLLSIIHKRLYLPGNLDSNQRELQILLITRIQTLKQPGRGDKVCKFVVLQDNKL
jgi:hypothetical protein